MQIKTVEPTWNESQQRWVASAQANGRRKWFYSAKSGRSGRMEAKRKAERWLLELSEETNKSVTVVWTEFIKDLKERKGCGSSTVDQLTKFGRNYILPVCGEKPLCDLTEDDLQRVLDLSFVHGGMAADSTRQSKGNLSKKTLQGIRSAITQFVKWCRKRRYTSLVLEGLEIPHGAKAQQKRILQPDEVQKLFRCDTRLYRGRPVFDDMVYSYRFAVVTGLRPGELMGLRIGDVSRLLVNVQGAVNYDDERTLGKNENAQRTFGLNEYAAELVRLQVNLLKTTGQPTDEEALLFPAYNQKSRYNRWKCYAESNGITAVSCYELRHTFVSIVHNLPDGDLRQLVGHSKSMDTLGTYAHKVKGSDARIASEVTGIFDAILASEA